MTDKRARQVKLLRWFLASVVMLWMSTAWWSESIDDLYITLVYAHEVVENGRLTWSTGEVVEGYSHFLWLVYLTAGVALGLDGSQVALWGSLASGVAVLGVASHYAPADWRGHALLVALCIWHPLPYWSAMGMEGPTYAVALTLAWVLGLNKRTWVWGMAWMAAAWLLRPEGMLQFAALLAVRPLLGSWERRDWRVLGVLAALALYHGVRVSYFGYFWATPTVVKVGHVSWGGTAQVGADLVVAMGVLAVAWVGWRAKSPLCWAALIPLGIQVATEFVAGGDWMAHGRLTMPGVVAAAVVWVVFGEARKWRIPPYWAVLLGGTLPCVVSPRSAQIGFPAVERWMSPLSWAQASTATPLETVVQLIVVESPSHSVVLTHDVGVAGHIPMLALRDSIGLVDLEFAYGDWRSSIGPFSESNFGPGGISRWVISWWGERREVELPGGPVKRLPHARSFPVPGGVLDMLQSDLGVATPLTIRTRWCAMARRFPSHGSLVGACDAWKSQLGEMLVESSDAFERATFIRGTHLLRYTKDRGYAMYWNGALRTVPLHSQFTLHVDVDDPGVDGARVAGNWEGDCESDAIEWTVSEPSKFVLNPPCPGSVLVVSFLNDDRTDDTDRNAYVFLSPLTL